MFNWTKMNKWRSFITSMRLGSKGTLPQEHWKVNAMRVIGPTGRFWLQHSTRAEYL